jgi:hypothetical protein
MDVEPRPVAEECDKDGALSNCGTSRMVGWDCTITVTFKRTATGARRGRL